MRLALGGRARVRGLLLGRNRLIERKVAELGGLKSLYSDSYYTKDEFWRVFDHPAYSALKARYDPAGALPDLYTKCVLRE